MTRREQLVDVRIDCRTNTSRLGGTLGFADIGGTGINAVRVIVTSAVVGMAPAMERESVEGESVEGGTVEVT